MTRRFMLGFAILFMLAPGPFAASEISEIESGRTSAPSPDAIANERALVIAYDGTNRCALFDGDGNLVFGEGGITVITFSTNGNMMARCQAHDLANSTGAAVSYDGDDNPFGPGTKCSILAPTGLCLTDTWINTISASGQSTVVCHFRNASCE